METGGRPDYGVCAAVDVHYLKTGGARAAAVLAADAAFAYVLAERTAIVPRVPPYRPGRFYLRELPALRAVLEDLSGLGLLVVDGYADLDPGGRPGLGAHAHAEFGIPVIGVACSRPFTVSMKVTFMMAMCRRGEPRRAGCRAGFRWPGCRGGGQSVAVSSAMAVRAEDSSAMVLPAV